MNERTKELVAIGSAAAAGCHDCLRHHVAEANRLSIDADEVSESIDIGMLVNRAAGKRTRKFAEELLGDDAEGSATEPESACERPAARCC